MATKNNANLPMVEQLQQAGLFNHLPKAGPRPLLKENCKKFLRLIDEQDAINRFTWFNLPSNLTGQELERMLFYKGQLCFFYMKDLDQFYFMPYALDGTIDFYGRFNTIHPVPMTNGKDDGKNYQAQEALLSQLKLKCVYGVKNFKSLELNDLYTSTVLLSDYSKQLSETIIPRSVINEPIIDMMAEIIPMLRTSLLTKTGVKGLRVQDADSASEVMDACRATQEAALNGSVYVPMIGNVDFQDLSGNAGNQSQDYFLTLESLDNLRLSAYGLDNGGLYQKKAHILESEQAMNNVNVGLIMQDALAIRQNFCNIVNSIWGLGIWVEPAEASTGVDMTGDGKAYEDDIDGNQSGKENENESL